MVATRAIRPTTDVSAADLKSLQCPSLPLARSPNAVVCPRRCLGGRDGATRRKILAALSLARRVAAGRPAGRPDRGSDACRDRHPRADGDRPARRLRAADRLLRLHRRQRRLCHARRQPLPVLRRRLHHHADLRRRVSRAGRDRLGRLSDAGDRAGADRRCHAGGERRCFVSAASPICCRCRSPSASCSASPCTSWCRNCQACSACPRLRDQQSTASG